MQRSYITKTVRSRISSEISSVNEFRNVSKLDHMGSRRDRNCGGPIKVIGQTDKLTIHIYLYILRGYLNFKIPIRLIIGCYLNIESLRRLIRRGRGGIRIAIVRRI